MSDTLHIGIIGAGLIGLSTADALALRGAKVTVLETRSGPCEGASFSNSGMIHPSQALSWAAGADDDLSAAKAVHALATDSAKRLRDIMERLGLFADLSRETGCVQIFDTAESAQQALGVFTAIGVQATPVKESKLTFGRPGLRFAQDASGDARAYGCALESSLVERGVFCIYNVSDILLAQAVDRVEVTWSDATGQKTAQFDHLIIAAGAGSPALLSQFDLDLPVRPVTGWALDFARPVHLDAPAQPVMDAGSRSALTVFPDRVRLSGLWDAPSPETMIEVWRGIAPVLMGALGAPVRTWSGQRPVSAAGRPYISATSIPGLWVNAGHGHMGWTLCAGSAAVMADMILDARRDDRFIFAG